MKENYIQAAEVRLLNVNSLHYRWLDEECSELRGLRCSMSHAVALADMFLHYCELAYCSLFWLSPQSAALTPFSRCSKHWKVKKKALIPPLEEKRKHQSSLRHAFIIQLGQFLIYPYLRMISSIKYTLQMIWLYLYTWWNPREICYHLLSNEQHQGEQTFICPGE